MKLQKFKSFGFWMFMLCLVPAVAGCGAPGGSEGDQNDPAVNGEDDASMQNETGTFQEQRNNQGDGAGAV